MLRLLLLLLVAANALFFAWSQGFLAQHGWAPSRISEPERMQQELQPQAIRLLNSPRAPAQSDPALPANQAASAAPLEPTSCLWAAGFSPEQAEVLRTGLTALSLPQSAWSLTENRSNGRWIVYWGKFEQPDVMARRKATLRRLKIEFREVTLPRLAPGLALGTFSSEAAARESLVAIQAKGVRTASVAVERPESLSWTCACPL